MINATPVVLTVSQLNRYVKSVIDNDDNLKYIFLVGEISNFTNHRSGHMYFTLKDENCAVKAVMFKGNAMRLRFMPQDGMSIIARGRISVFEAAGQYQFYVDDMQPDGVGALTMQFEQLKEKLYNEGLFDSSHKKPLPKFPQTIGVITSPTGAAVQDIKNILSRRFKCADVLLYPAQVQGEYAEAQLIKGLEYFNKNKNADVIIIGRGGGSIEDLWAFNSEKLARKIYECEIPVISAVGHETDFTIADFVADFRAETPSAAAENAVPDANQQKIYISRLNNALLGYTQGVIASNRDKLKVLSNSDALKSPLKNIENMQMVLDGLTDRLNLNQKNYLEKQRLKFASAVSNLNSLSPLNVLSRGYSAVFHNGENINSVKKINKNDELNIKLSDGEVLCTVKEIL